MPVIGNSATPGFGWNLTSSWKEIATLFTNTSGGDIQLTTLHGYFAGSGATIPASLVVWDSAGNILWNSATFNAPSGSSGVGHQSWNAQAIPSGSQPVVHNNGQVFIGWWVGGGTMLFSVTGSGVWKGKQSVSSPGAFTGFSQPGSPLIQGGLGAYADWVTPGGGGGGGQVGLFPIRRSSVWTDPQWLIRHSGAWPALQWFIRRSAAWTQLE